MNRDELKQRVPRSTTPPSSPFGRPACPSCIVLFVFSANSIPESLPPRYRIAGIPAWRSTHASFVPSQGRVSHVSSRQTDNVREDARSSPRVKTRLPPGDSFTTLNNCRNLRERGFGIGGE